LELEIIISFSNLQKKLYLKFLTLIQDIVILNKSFEQICIITEKFNIKSLIWTPENTILYNTINHVKYGFLNADTGILKCVENPGYILKVHYKHFFLNSLKTSNNSITYLEKNGEVITHKVDMVEYQFKLALLNKDGKAIKSILW